MRISRTCTAELVGPSDCARVVGRRGGLFVGHPRGAAAAPAAVGCSRQTVAAATAERPGIVTARRCISAHSGCDTPQQRRLSAASAGGPCFFPLGADNRGQRRSRRRPDVQAVTGTAAGGADGGQHLLSMLGQLMAGMQRQQQAAPTGSHLAVRGLSFQPAGATLRLGNGDGTATCAYFRKSSLAFSGCPRFEARSTPPQSDDICGDNVLHALLSVKDG